MFKSKKSLIEKIDLLNAQLHIANAQVSSLVSEKEALKTELERERKARYTVGWSVKDPSPDDEKKRADYISKVITFFEEILTPKIEQLYVQAVQELQNPLNGRDYDLQVKGVINALSQVLDWRDECIAETQQQVQDNLNKET